MMRRISVLVAFLAAWVTYLQANFCYSDIVNHERKFLFQRHLLESGTKSLIRFSPRRCTPNENRNSFALFQTALADTIALQEPENSLESIRTLIDAGDFDDATMQIDALLRSNYDFNIQFKSKLLLVDIFHRRGEHEKVQSLLQDMEAASPGLLDLIRERRIAKSKPTPIFNDAPKRNIFKSHPLLEQRIDAIDRFIDGLETSAQK